MRYNTLVSTSILSDQINNPDWVIFDCRFSLSDYSAGLQAYHQGHLPNAHYVHLNDDLSAPMTQSSGRHPLPVVSILASKLGQWGVADKTQLVLYDDVNGAIAGRMWWLLHSLGHRQTAVLDGGITQWRKEKRDLTCTIPVKSDSVFHPSIDSFLWLSTEQIQNGLKNQSICLIDARTAARYIGQEEPIDAVAGHIPGALNRPLQLNLNENGLFLSKQALRKQFLILLGSYQSDAVVHMCGSGVTACHNLLAMEIAGLNGSRLYPGSWSEWIKDETRPICSNDKK